MRYGTKALLIYLGAMAVTAVINEATGLGLPAVHMAFLGLFMFASSMLVHFFTLRSAQGEPKRFPSHFMAVTGVKMLVYLIAIGSYAYLFRDTAIPVVIAFLTLYVAYTALEVTSALSALRERP